MQKIMRKTLLASTVIAALGVCGLASAQATGNTAPDTYPYGITVRGGVAIPADSSLSDAGNVLGNLGLEYTLAKSLLATGDTYFALDYFFRGFGGGDSDGSAVPFTLNQRFYTGNKEFRSYFFVGVGATYITTNMGNGTAITLRGGVGQELGPRVIAEIGAYVSDKAAGARANAFTFNVGYRL